MKDMIKIIVVNGSPKGEKSLTLQHSLYMLGQTEGVEYLVLQAGEALSPIDYDAAWLDSAIATIKSADAIIWTTPVYTMLVPWQLIRFFALIQTAGEGSILRANTQRACSPASITTIIWRKIGYAP